MEENILDDFKILHPSTNSIGNWTEYEDEVILKYVHSLIGHKNKNLAHLAVTLPSRRAKQVRERWFNHINPIIKK